MTNLSQSQDAIRAAQKLKQWGRYATLRYLEQRHVPADLFRLARQLEAVKHLNNLKGQ